MPVSIDIDKSRRIVVVEYFGALVRDDLDTLAKALIEDPDFQPDFDQLIDGREVEEVQLTADDLAENTRLNLFGLESRRAGVAQDDFAFAMARMFEMLRGDKPDEIKIFRSIEEATEWLEMKPLSDA